MKGRAQVGARRYARVLECRKGRAVSRVPFLPEARSAIRDHPLQMCRLIGDREVPDLRPAFAGLRPGEMGKRRSAGAVRGLDVSGGWILRPKWCVSLFSCPSAPETSPRGCLLDLAEVLWRNLGKGLWV